MDLVSGAVNSFYSNGYNLVGDGTAMSAFNQTGDVNNNADPGLSPLAENGGPTRTRASTPASPARDTGSTTLTVDQRGVARPFGPADDKGAYEFAPTPSLVVTTLADEDNGTSDPAFGAGTSLREAIACANSDGVGSIITFSPTVFAAPRKTITLNGTQLPPILANGPCTIAAPVAGVAISGNGQSRVLQTNPGSVVTLRGLTITGGQLGSDFGGAGILSYGTMLVDSCTLSGNTAGYGGAIFANTDLATEVTLRNCTLSGNTATITGGAIYNAIGLTTLDSCTIASNTAPLGKGSGVASAGNASTRTSARNSILSGNANTDVDFVSGGVNSFASTGYNLVGDGNATAAFNQPGDLTGNVNPGLLPLGENGGPSATRGFFTGSPAINGGDTTLAVDQRGVARPQATRDDIGAYELPGTSFVDSLIVTTVADEDNGTADPNVGTGTSLREAIIFANSNADVSTITFNLPGGAQTITLGSALPDLTTSVNIQGPGAKLLAISGNNAVRVFHIPGSGLNIALSGLTVRNGNAPAGDFASGILSRSALTLTDCFITANTGTLGAGVALIGANGTFTRCTFAGNGSTEQGGAINFQGDNGRTLTLVNCTLSGNSATGSGYGGGILNVSTAGTSTLDLLHCTIANNITTTTAVNAGGVSTVGVSGGTAVTTLRNTIVAENSAPNLARVGPSSVTSSGNNLASDNGGGFLTQPADLPNTAPRLAPLGDYGGPIFTRALLAGSPALDRAASGVSTDQRNRPRPIDDPAITNAVGGNASDIGAVEMNRLAGPDLNGNGMADDFETLFGVILPGADPDGDGQSNLAEFRAGTDPTNPADALAILSIARSGADIVITFRAVATRTYRLEYKAQLTDPTWQPIPTVPDLTPSTNGPAPFTHPGGATVSPGFYRVRVL